MEKGKAGTQQAKHWRSGEKSSARKTWRPTGDLHRERLQHFIELIWPGQREEVKDLMKNKDFFDIQGDCIRFLMMHLRCRVCHRGVALRGNHFENQLKMETLGSTDLGGNIFTPKDTFKICNWWWKINQNYGYWAFASTQFDIFTQEMRIPCCMLPIFIKK